MAHLAGTLTDRAGVRLKLEVDEADVTPEARADLLDIVSEAISKAVRNVGASAIKIRLANGHGLRPSMADDGSGFDPDRVGTGRPGAGRGFGLISVRDRAEQLGGSLRVRSRAGGGTKVEVALP